MHNPGGLSGWVWGDYGFNEPISNDISYTDLMYFRAKCGIVANGILRINTTMNQFAVVF